MSCSLLKAKSLHLKATSGQIIVEVLVAVSVLTIGFLGVITLLSRALSLNRVVSDNYTATYLAAEGIELAKNIIDGNAATFGWGAGANQGAYEIDVYSTALAASAEDRPLLFDPAARLYSYRSGIPTSFMRKVTVTPIEDGTAEIQVNSEVAWVTRGGGRSRVNVEDHFFNWK